jgi:glutamate synthase domain-containing protein 2/uncharacterized Fe-S cluster protein YjdI
LKKKSNSSIETKEDGPYVTSELSNFKTSRGDKAKTSKTMVLCRCGHSESKPFCDGSHIKVNFKSEKIEGRQSDTVDDYIGRGIIIHDNRGVCSHIGYCTDSLPSVFRMDMEPWIDPDGACVEDIIKVIKMCPSGALSYSVDCVKHDSLDREPSISLRRDGPYHIVGGVGLVDYDKSKPESKEHFTLCRCGGSKNKPFCDGTHFYIDFKDEESKIPLENCREETIGEYLGILKRNDDDIEQVMTDIHQISVTGKSIVEPMRTKKHVISWNDILIKGAQLAKIPLDENVPISTKTIIGPKAKKPLILQTPIYVTHMSFGALSKEIKIALAKGSNKARTAIGSGEGGIVEESLQNSYKYIFEYVPNKYSVTDQNLKRVDAVEIKIGQSAKPGLGGHLPSKKVTSEIGRIRGYPQGSDILSPAHFPEINNRDELRQVVDILRKKTGGKPIGVKIAAGNIEDDLKIALYSNPDFITIDGRPGATASALKTVKDSTSIPTIFALYRARKYFDKNNIKDVSLIITGGLRISSDFAKALAMGADAIAIGTAALMAVACQQHRICHTGDCPVGVTTQKPELRSRLSIDKSAKKLENFLQVSTEEIKIFTRLTGHNDIHNLNINDLTTVNSEISNHTNIKHA